MEGWWIVDAVDKQMWHPILGSIREYSKKDWVDFYHVIMCIRGKDLSICIDFHLTIMHVEMELENPSMMDIILALAWDGKEDASKPIDWSKNEKA